MGYDVRRKSPHPFVQVATCVARDSKLSMQARALYAIILSYARQDGETFVSQARLAQDSGVTDRTIRNWLKELVDAKLVTITRRQRDSNLIELADERDVWLRYASRKDISADKAVPTGSLETDASPENPFRSSSDRNEVSSYKEATTTNTCGSTDVEDSDELIPSAREFSNNESGLVEVQPDGKVGFKHQGLVNELQRLGSSNGKPAPAVVRRMENLTHLLHSQDRLSHLDDAMRLAPAASSVTSIYQFLDPVLQELGLTMEDVEKVDA